MEIDEHEKLRSENDEWNPMRDKNEGVYREGRREDTCDHGFLSR